MFMVYAVSKKEYRISKKQNLDTHLHADPLMGSILMVDYNSSTVLTLTNEYAIFMTLVINYKIYK